MTRPTGERMNREDRSSKASNRKQREGPVTDSSRTVFSFSGRAPLRGAQPETGEVGGGVHAHTSTFGTSLLSGPLSIEWVYGSLFALSA